MRKETVEELNLLLSCTNKSISPSRVRTPDANSTRQFFTFARLENDVSEYGNAKSFPSQKTPSEHSSKGIENVKSAYLKPFISKLCRAERKHTSLEANLKFSE